jgi:hypothetical protein
MKDEKRTDERLGTGEISVKSSPFLSWLDNFWYHYKWQTLGVLFALIVVTVCVLQTCSKESYDLSVVYAGPVAAGESGFSDLELLLEDHAEDADKDGEKSVNLLRYNIYSADQIKELEKAGFSVSRSYNSGEYDNYGNFLMTGEASVYFLDPWLYEELKSADRLRPLAELLPEERVASASADGYGLCLGDSELYRQYDVLSFLPEDTVICLLRQQVIGKSRKDEHYEKEEALFCALAERTVISEVTE